MQNIKNIGVVGSRSFNNYKFLKHILDMFKFKNIKIISGGADGADSLSIQYAKENGFDFQEFLPNWRPNGVYDKSAGFKRNKVIVENSDIIIAFWDGFSPGTRSTISIAKNQNKRYYIFWSGKQN